MGKMALGIAALGLVASLAIAADARGGGEAAIAVGEVSAQAAARSDVDGALRTMVEEAVSAIDAAKLPHGERATLRAAVASAVARVPEALRVAHRRR